MAVVLAAGCLAGALRVPTAARAQTEAFPSAQKPAEIQKTAPVSPQPVEQWTQKRVLSMLSVRDYNVLESNMRKLQGADVVPALDEILRDSKITLYVRLGAVTLLGRIGTQQARGVILEHRGTTPPLHFSMDDMYGHLEVALEECMRRESEKELLADLHHPNADVKALAVSELGTRKSTAAVPELIRLLDDPNQKVAQWATGALGDIQDPKGIRVLITVVEKGGDSWPRRCAIAALGNVNMPECLRALKSLSRDDPFYAYAAQSPVVRAEALKEQASTFRLLVQWHSPPGRKASSRGSLALTVRKEAYAADWTTARITDKEVASIVDYLFSVEYFRRARPYPGVVLTSRDEIDGYYSLEAKADRGPHLAERFLSDSDRLRDSLGALQKVVNRDAASAIEKVRP